MSNDNRNGTGFSCAPASSACYSSRAPATGSMTPADRRGREKKLIEEARRAAMADPSMRSILAGLAKR